MPVTVVSLRTRAADPTLLVRRNRCKETTESKITGQVSWLTGILCFRFPYGQYLRGSGPGREADSKGRGYTVRMCKQKGAHFSVLATAGDGYRLTVLGRGIEWLPAHPQRVPGFKVLTIAPGMFQVNLYICVKNNVAQVRNFDFLRLASQVYIVRTSR